MKHLIHHNRDMLDSIMILIAAGIATGLYCTSRMNLDSIQNYSTALLSTLVVPENPAQFFVQQCLTNIVLCLVIFAFGLSLIGIPLIQFCVFLKGFQVGFSSALFLYTYHMKGILGILMALLPQILFDICAIALTAVCAMKLSAQLIVSLMDKTARVEFKKILNQQLDYLFVSFMLTLFSSALKSTLGLALVELFTKID